MRLCSGLDKIDKLYFMRFVQLWISLMSCCNAVVDGIVFRNTVTGREV
jgi:hypothetical protein